MGNKRAERRKRKNARHAQEQADDKEELRAKLLTYAQPSTRSDLENSEQVEDASFVEAVLVEDDKNNVLIARLKAEVGVYQFTCA
ncbi:hypothetical protein Pmar_PMAR011631 [Perkinsus marinus ATCC 50983]|uniref:Uncharacterized protein n=1 Tax=Perkinsus marinus (strain ATCC 50983 / TXsc) TaxID=423536 RepID=C5LCB7_PERM5|nr:hypothetical protein Pmar_PMAR011631 [Perkinsus marinus ATCC 50983]EER05600.1 hypothetical protein Pmar_PMAR011631 [Perkinsus marinus ATCC 50983]|eukprot:XP_002773784.1 hypothetical protein Pmar_PMAR011631 [Perkinsus marinus ATCC 50983]